VVGQTPNYGTWGSPQTPVTSRILLADDDPQVRRLFARRLRNAGYSVHEAKSGSEALSLLKNMRVHLLILDLAMPDKDGFEVLKVVKEEHPSVPVLVISGYMDGALLEAAECLGAAVSLDKARAGRMLLPTVRKILE